MTGNELKTRRQNLGLSQEKLAHALELAGSTIGRIEQLKEAHIPNARMYDLALKQLEAEKQKKESKGDV